MNILSQPIGPLSYYGYRTITPMTYEVQVFTLAKAYTDTLSNNLKSLATNIRRAFPSYEDIKTALVTTSLLEHSTIEVGNEDLTVQQLSYAIDEQLYEDSLYDGLYSNIANFDYVVMVRFGRRLRGQCRHNIFPDGQPYFDPKTDQVLIVGS